MGAVIVEPRPKEPNLESKKVSLANFWHPVATSDEVVGQPKPFMLLGESLVMFRDSQGVAVFKDLCIHRGTALSLGSITDGRIICGYHGWEYDRTGACVHIPSLPPGSPVPRKARAIVYTAREAYGLVWVALDEPVQPIPPWPDNSYDDPSFHTFLVGHYVWKSSAGRACENGMDFSHFNFTHRGFTELANGPVVKQHEVKEEPYKLEYSYIDENTCRDYIIHAPFSIYIKKYAVGRAANSTAWDARSTPEGGMTVLTQFSSPRDETTTDVFAHIGRNHTLDADDGEFAGKLAHEVLEQDRLIVESQRPERIPTDLREEMHLKVPDATGIAYRRMLSRLDSIGAFMP